MEMYKFKIWDNKNEEMWYPLDLNFSIKAEVILIDNDYIANLPLSDDIKILQYINREDENNIELYEEDICYLKYTYIYGEPIELIGVIEFDKENSKYGIRITNHDFFNYLYFDDTQVCRKVQRIGNVNNTPERLNILSDNAENKEG